MLLRRYHPHPKLLQCMGRANQHRIQSRCRLPPHLTSNPPIPTRHPTQPTSILFPALFVLLGLSQGTTQAARPISSAEQVLKPHEGEERGEGGKSRLMLAPDTPHMITAYCVHVCLCMCACARLQSLTVSAALSLPFNISVSLVLYPPLRLYHDIIRLCSLSKALHFFLFRNAVCLLRVRTLNLLDD